MAEDIVFWNEESDKLEKASEELGYSDIFYLVNIKEIDEVNDVQELSKNKKFIFKINYEEFKNKSFVKKMKNKFKSEKYFVILDFSSISRDKEFINKTREVFSSKLISAVVGLEEWSKRDSFNFKSSGLSKALCQLAVQNDIALIFSLKKIISKKGTERSKFLGRIKQNINLCMKYKVKLCLASFAEKPNEISSSQDMQALAEILGMNTKIVKDSIEQDITAKIVY